MLPSHTSRFIFFFAHQLSRRTANIQSTSDWVIQKHLTDANEWLTAES